MFTHKKLILKKERKKNTIPSVKHGGGPVMFWAGLLCMALHVQKTMNLKTIKEFWTETHDPVVQSQIPLKILG